MPLPDEFWADLQDSLAGARKARSKPLSFALLPPKQASSPCWMIIGKSSAVRNRLKAARKVGRTAFKVGATAQGQIEPHQGRFILIVDKGDATALQSGLKTWAARLVGAAKLHPDAGALQAAGKVAALLRAAQVYTQAEAEQRPWADAGAEDGDPAGLYQDESGQAVLSDEELHEMFGDETPEVMLASSDAFARLSAVGLTEGVPDAAPVVLAADVQRFQADAKTALATGGLDAAVALLFQPQHDALLGGVQSLLSAGVEPADARQAVILDVLQALGELNALRRRWERAVARLEDAQADYLDVEAALKTATSTAELDMAELDALHEALALAETRHTRFRLAAEELERTVFQAADRCGEMLLQTETGD